jgi:hypothetical protein
MRQTYIHRHQEDNNPAEIFTEREGLEAILPAHRETHHYIDPTGSHPGYATCNTLPTVIIHTRS